MKPLTACICANPGVQATVRTALDRLVGNAVKRIVVCTSVEEFAEVKKSGERLAVFVTPMPESNVLLRDVLDDHADPTRRAAFVYSSSAGVDSYALHEMQTLLHGVPFHNAQGCFANILAEHVIYAMLYFNRFSWQVEKDRTEKRWNQFNMIELKGQKVGVLGYGNIGQACGEMARALGMEVVGVRRSGTGKVINGVTVRGEDATDEVLRTSDFIVGVLPGTKATRHFFNRNVFAKMKPNAVFINIGRGVTQCETDVVDALERGVIRGAALDVFEVEPLPKTSPLWDVPNEKLLYTPHCADWTEDLIKKSAERFAGILEDYATTGASSAYQVSVEKGY